MKFNFIAPFRTHFNLNTDLVFVDENRYKKLWDRVEKLNSLKGFNIFFNHVSDEDNTQYKYKKITEDSTDLDATVFKYFPKINQEQLKFYTDVANECVENKQFHTQLMIELNTVRIDIYDNTVGIIDLSFNVNFDRSLNTFEEFLNTIQEWSNMFIDTLLKTEYDTNLSKIIDEITKEDGQQFTSSHKDIIELLNTTHQSNYRKGQKKNCSLANYEYLFGKPLWTNRSLLIKEEDKQLFPIMKENWIYGDETYEAVEKRVFSNDCIYVGWGHNLINEGCEPQKLNDVLAAINLAQYYYTVLDFINESLTKLIGKSTNTSNMRQTQQNNLHLRRMIDSINILLIQYNDTKLQLQSNRKVYVQLLSEKWSMENLITNIKGKIEICKEKIESIFQLNLKRNQKITERILIALAGIALIDFSLSLSQFGRAIYVNPDLAPQDNWIPGLLNIGLSYTPNIVLWGGFLLFFSVYLLFLIHQRRGQ
ncbi:hypothetical protein [Alkalihalobacterium sp. APHAB7]|uniref:hypothetical protein n=1 Tax=Alkalihalobacterium sp. APHAB7 TaxID=3402081 RepID=UPI003AABBC60